MEEKERYELSIGGNYIIDNDYKTSIFFSEVLNVLNRQDKENQQLKQQLEESEKSKEINIRERDKICLEMATDYNKQIMQLNQQLHDLPKKIVGEIKKQLFNHFKVKNIEEYEKLPLIDSLFTLDTVIEILDTILLELVFQKQSKGDVGK